MISSLPRFGYKIEFDFIAENQVTKQNQKDPAALVVNKRDCAMLAHEAPEHGVELSSVGRQLTIDTDLATMKVLRAQGHAFMETPHGELKVVRVPPKVVKQYPNEPVYCRLVRLMEPCEIPDDSIRVNMYLGPFVGSYLVDQFDTCDDVLHRLLADYKIRQEASDFYFEVERRRVERIVPCFSLYAQSDGEGTGTLSVVAIPRLVGGGGKRGPKNQKKKKPKGKGKKAPKVVVHIDKGSSSSAGKQVYKFKGQPKLSGLTEQALFKLSNVDPFDDRARGVRVPEDLPLETETFMVSGECNLAVGVGGNAQVAFLGSPTLSAAWWGTGVTLTGDNGIFANNTFAGFMATAGALAAQVAAFRTAAWGVCIKNNAPFNTVCGKLVVAPVVMGRGTTIPWCGLQNGQTMSAGNFQTNVLGLGNGYPKVSQMPGAQEFTLDSLIDKCLILPGRITDAAGRDFKRVNVSSLVGAVNASYYFPDETGEVFDTTMLPNNSVANTNFNPATSVWDTNKDTDLSGQIFWLMEIIGAPPSSSPLTVSFKYHLEGQVASQTSAGNIIPTMPDRPASNGKTWVDILRELRNQPIMRYVANQAWATALDGFRGSGYRVTSRLLN